MLDGRQLHACQEIGVFGLLGVLFLERNPRGRGICQISTQLERFYLFGTTYFLIVNCWEQLEV